MPKKNKREQVSQEELGGVMRHFLEHVTEHDPTRVHAAVIMVANEVDREDQDPEGARAMHVCHFGAGDPEILANIMADAIDGLINNNPGFSEAFNTVMKRRALKEIFKQIGDQIEDMREDNNLSTVKDTADEVIKKAMSSGLPGNDTKH